MERDELRELHCIVRTGDLLRSGMQTHVNTVNCVGVMGKGIALQFRRAYPAMFKDYARRCAAREVRLGEPYLYREPAEAAPPHPVQLRLGEEPAPYGARPSPWILNFPIKGHWRALSRLEDLDRGLDHLEARYREWGVESLAVPAIGCQNGGLRWADVGPRLLARLERLGIPVEIYAPHEAAARESTEEYLRERLAERAAG